jgi:hypothetical protein
VTARACPGCPKQRDPGKYLCGDCWRALPAAARRLLRKRDRFAVERLRQLLDQLREGVPPHGVEITR